MLASVRGGLVALLFVLGACSAPVASAPVTATLTADAKPAGKASVALASDVVTAPTADFRAAWRAHLAAERRVQIERLRAYRIQGRFPINRVRPGRLNVFVDDRTGAHCAVANLIALSGQEELVQRTARENNFVRLADVSSGPLHDWVLTSGLTQEEVVFIQEPYSYEPQAAPLARRLNVAAAEKARLRRHFAEVERRLLRDNDASLDLAVSRLPAALLARAPVQS
jgi:hypothetical protein